MTDRSAARDVAFPRPEPGRTVSGGLAGAWQGLGRLLSGRWGGDWSSQAVRLWAGARSATPLPLTLRVRAATALDPFPR